MYCNSNLNSRCAWPTSRWSKEPKFYGCTWNRRGALEYGLVNISWDFLEVLFNTDRNNALPTSSCPFCADAGRQPRGVQQQYVGWFSSPVGSAPKRDTGHPPEVLLETLNSWKVSSFWEPTRRISRWNRGRAAIRVSKSGGPCTVAQLVQSCRPSEISRSRACEQTAPDDLSSYNL